MAEQTGHRHLRLRVGSVAAVVLPCLCLQGSAAHAEDSWTSVFEMMNLKAKPADPAPDFVVRTRPDATKLDFLRPTPAHKVSPLKVKTPGEVQAAQAALDTARANQMNPTAPVQLSKAKPSRKGSAAALPEDAGEAAPPADPAE